MATQALLDFYAHSAPVDGHLADQLLLPATLVAAPSHYCPVAISPHRVTNTRVIEQFQLARITLDQDAPQVTVEPTSPP